MPELPDVEGFRRYLARHGAGKRVERVEVADPVIVRNTTPQGLGRALTGECFATPRRHGKWVFADAGGATVAMHFGMTGLLHWSADPDYRHRHDRVVFALDGGRLAYRNMRRFGGIWLAHGPRELERVTGPLGPDAMTVGRDQLAELLEGRRGALKPALMDQRLIAGLGNLLVDEILWRSRIHPRLAVGRLDDARIDRVHDVMTAVLREANRHARVPPKEGWLTKARDERDARCPRDGTRLRRAQVGGRTTCWCPRCQREPRS